MIKLFVSDLDGTLLDMDHFIKNEDIDAIHDIVNRNVPITVASGRMDHEIQEVMKRVGVPAHRVSQNGAFVYDSNHEHIYSKTFDGALARKVMAAIESEPLVKTVSTADKTYTEEHNEWIDFISQHLFHDIIVAPDMVDQFGAAIAPSKITLHGHENEVMDAFKRIDSHFVDEIDSFISHETCVDVMPKAINKGNGLRSLMKELDVNPEEIACVGDSFNDIAMFELTPHSYAMSTAHDDVKRKANTIVDHVHEAIEDLEKKGLL
ncbi:HAD family hydrolase [Halobacillus yeomjeoni]|uniref:HAD family hydrolase n=1 Tax=Halobacillus yeomjeoni TaxID=311194 RepID=UPI001CD74D76|nr:HAD family hydrolase [Halobacillus yeomjeoni]MCA0984033.1 HAD family hydrolase [Halobacillus yeomjeoni]